MAPRFSRYAVYYTPPPGPLADFGAGWLGWDLLRGRAAAAPPDLSASDFSAPHLAACTEAPRRYGFHATIKPPFSLAPGCSEADLCGALRRLGADLSPIRTAPLRLDRLGRFLALTLSEPNETITDLAARIVTELDDFRAPMSAAEQARRQTPHLSPRQQQNLRDWGYPHVLADFRFHMTLTGRLDRQALARVQEILSDRLVRLLNSPFALDSLSIVGERADSMFVEIDRIALTGRAP
ncbi:DUF1045 domain-containing protein [Sulfitobacter aestuarii]|uniref:DUF1045 domain-containing protein n=1 Tax=Sulfitobacter aestuarii TaxID=2161676 RepID=A0ABW5U267_9RHOB